MLEKSGFGKYRFYYPYPDYKLPNEIFTDFSINRNKRPYNTYDVDRYSLFYEADFHNVLQRERVDDIFANSFLVEARENEECSGSILYVKQNQERKEKFRVETVIFRNKENLFVKKIAPILCPDSSDTYRCSQTTIVLSTLGSSLCAAAFRQVSLYICFHYIVYSLLCQ